MKWVACGYRLVYLAGQKERLDSTGKDNKQSNTGEKSRKNGGEGQPGKVMKGKEGPAKEIRPQKRTPAKGHASRRAKTGTILVSKASHHTTYYMPRAEKGVYIGVRQQS